MATQIFTHSNGDIRVSYSITQNISANTSTISITKIEFRSKNYRYTNFYGEGGLYINGTQVVAFNNSITYSTEYVSETNVWYDISNSAGTTTVTVTHNADGTGSFKMYPHGRSGTSYSDFYIFCLAAPAGNATYNENRTVTLPTIDRNPPTITASITPLSNTSFKITATADVACSAWWYRISGYNWVEYTPTNNEFTVTGAPTGVLSVDLCARKTSNNVLGYLNSLVADLTNPTVTFSISNIGVYGFKITASANTTCNSWDYKIGNGSWTNFSAASGTSANVTLNSLSPNTSYSVAVRARKSANSFYGSAAAQTVKTLGPSTLNSASTFAIDVASPVIPINLTVYGIMYHKLHIYKGSTLIASHNIGRLTERTEANLNVSLTSAERTAILNAMTTVKSMTVKIYLETFTDSGYSNSIGRTGPKNASATTSSAVSGPTWTGFTYADTENAVVTVTGDNQVLVQHLSQLVVSCATATAKNKATITGYSAVIGDVSLQSSETTLEIGAITSSGNLTLTVTVSDSRGYSASATATVKVLSYKGPTINSLLLRRRNEIDEIVQLTMSGSVPSIKPSSAEKNQIVSVYFKYKLTNASSYTTVTLTNDITITGLSFSYTNNELLSLDATKSYKFEFYVKDKFGNLTLLKYDVILNQGTPILSLRKRTSTYNFPRVGINNPTPIAPLDVAGDIHMNGLRIMGFVCELGQSNINLNTLVDPGIYTQKRNVDAITELNYPVTKAGYLEVITNQAGYVLQRYTAYDCTGIYIRYRYNSSWGAWKRIDGAIPDPLPVTKGGTGASTAADAINNLGAASYALLEWNPVLYDNNTEKISLGSATYLKIGGLYVMFMDKTLSVDVSISTMLQIRGLPSPVVSGGNIYINGISGNAGEITIQPTSNNGRLYLRPNIKGEFVSGNRIAGVFFGRD